MANYMKYLLITMVLSSLVLVFWNQVPIISQTVHAVLDPTFGYLLGLNGSPTLGMFIIIICLSFITTLVQKYGTDQATLKELKKEQKILQGEMKKYKDNPQKVMELNKKQMEFIPKTMELTMRPVMYTAVFFVLFFGWFRDYFLTVDFKFLGFLSWVWFYLIFSIIFGTVFRKILKTA
jgi:uncharacterized membrane protein (DUF106 family)